MLNIVNFFAEFNSQEQIDEFLFGHSLPEIANKAGCSVAVVRAWLVANEYIRERESA